MKVSCRGADDITEEIAHWRHKSRGGEGDETGSPSRANGAQANLTGGWDAAPAALVADSGRRHVPSHAGVQGWLLELAPGAAARALTNRAAIAVAGRRLAIPEPWRCGVLAAEGRSVGMRLMRQTAR